MMLVEWRAAIVALVVSAGAGEREDGAALKEAVAKNDSKAVAGAARSVAAQNDVGAVKALVDAMETCGRTYQAELVRYLQNRRVIESLQSQTNTDLGQKGSGDFDKCLIESYRLSDRLLEAERSCYEISKAFSSINSEDAVRVLITRAASGKSKPLGDYLSEAMGYVSHEDIIPALLKILEGNSGWRTKVACLDALGLKGGHRNAILPRIRPFLGDPDARIMRAAHEATRTLSGQVAAKNGDSAAAIGGGGRGATFYEMRVLSNSVMFVVDASESMVKDDRIGTLKRELRKVISELPDNARANIVSFNCIVRLMTTTMITLSSKTRPSIEKYIESIDTRYVTNTYETFQTVFRILRGEIGDVSTGKEVHVADTIFFLTDGKPTVPQRLREDENARYMDPDNIIECVKFWNRRCRVTINTIGIGDAKGGKKADGNFLSRLARENNGKYTSH